MSSAVKMKLAGFGNWCGIAYAALLLLGWGLLGGFIPPHVPAASPDSIVAIFSDHTLRIRLGMLAVMVAAMVLTPFVAVIAQQLGHLEGRPGVLTYSLLLGGAGTMVLTFYPAIWWLVAAYRLERSQELIYLLNDMSWLQFLGGVTLFFPLPASVAVAAFCDERPSPPFPRWSGYVNVWIILLIVPDQLIFFFHRGPFAWNGLFGFWIPLAGFALWFGLMFVLLRRRFRLETWND